MRIKRTNTSIPMSSSTGLLALVSDSDEYVAPTSSDEIKLVPRSVSPSLELRFCPCSCRCLSCNSMISLVKSLSDRSRNKLQIPKSSPWNSLQSWKGGNEVKCSRLLNENNTNTQEEHHEPKRIGLCTWTPSKYRFSIFPEIAMLDSCCLYTWRE